VRVIFLCVSFDLDLFLFRRGGDGLGTVGGDGEHAGSRGGEGDGHSKGGDNVGYMGGGGDGEGEARVRVVQVTAKSVVFLVWR
jgi:hypothetical protein